MSITVRRTLQSQATAPPVPTFKTVTLRTQAGNYVDPQPTPNDQPLLFFMHGSGGQGTSWSSPLGQGTFYMATCGPDMGYIDDMQFQFYVYNSGGYPPGPNNKLQVGGIDFVLRNGAGLETYWFGYTAPGVTTPGHSYTWRKLEAMYWWVRNNYPQASQTKINATGNSMGGWCCIEYCIRHPEMFASVFGLQSAWRRDQIVQWDKGSGAVAPGTPIVEYGMTLGALHDMVSYVSDLGNILPFFLGTINTSDFFSPFTDYQDGIAAMRARIRTSGITNLQRNGFAFGWMPGQHGGGAGPGQVLITTLLTAYDQANFELGLGYPVFDNCSADNDPYTDATGYINRGFKWTRPVETPTTWSCQVTNEVSCTVDLAPHSSVFLTQVTPKSISITANVYQTVSFP